MNMVNFFTDSSNEVVQIVLLSLACFRVWLEIMGFNFQSLPMTKALARSRGEDSLNKFHKMGLVFSIGYIVFFAPSVLL